MRPFFNRILICLTPVVLSLLVIGWAYNRYAQGRGGFRLGVDLVGGTILVYEVDPTKQDVRDLKTEDLAAMLKRRIDPADLFNVTVRPIAGDPPRVEIILPTGGRQQAEAQRRTWGDVIHAVAAE